jgi:hypothetical protein
MTLPHAPTASCLFHANCAFTFSTARHVSQFLDFARRQMATLYANTLACSWPRLLTPFSLSRTQITHGFATGFQTYKLSTQGAGHSKYVIYHIR